MITSSSSLLEFHASNPGIERDLCVIFVGDIVSRCYEIAWKSSVFIGWVRPNVRHTKYIVQRTLPMSVRLSLMLKRSIFNLVDADDVDLFDALDLENRVKKLEEDFTRLLNAKKVKEAKEAEEAELKVNKEVVQVSSDKGFSGDEDVVCFNDVKYPLADYEIRMFKETPITSKGPSRQLAFTSTTSRAPIASTTSRGPRCVLALFAPNAPNAPPPFPP
ncbi:hypothetical protein Tco_1173314 [Tanacetum coccineum]